MELTSPAWKGRGCWTTVPPSTAHPSLSGWPGPMVTANGRVLSCLGATGATWLDLASPLPRDYGAHRSHGDPRFVGQLFSLTGFPGGLVVKNQLASAGDRRDVGSIPGSGRVPGGGHDNPLQYSLLPGDSHRQRRLVGYSPWSRKQSDMTEMT